MKILVIGGNGTIGKKVVERLDGKHEVLIGGRTADYPIDIANTESIKHQLAKVGELDSIICIAGEAKWAPFEEMQEEDYYIGIRSKLMGQVNLTRIGLHYLKDGGSITLTSGILADDPVNLTTSSAMVNGALHSFVKAAALEAPPGKRINVVSAGLVEDAKERYQDFFPGHNAIPMDLVVNGYVRSVEGKGSGDEVEASREP